MIDPRCDVEVGIHPGPFWRNKRDNLTVCSIHKSQYERRADEFGPFDWELLPDDFFEKVGDILVGEDDETSLY